MYKMSNVVYRLADGTIVRTLAEAQNSNQSYIKEYEKVFDEYEVDPITKAKRIKALGF